MKNAKNYPVNIEAKMKFSITKKDFQKFENHFIVEVIKYPTYRYGQAFLNYFLPEAQKHFRRSSGDQYDDIILYNLASFEEAKSFVKDRIEIG